MDTCCYNRPYDDQAQERVHLEGEAVLAIINKRERNNYEIIGSPALDYEMEQISNIDKREKVKTLYAQAINERLDYTIVIRERVEELSGQTTIRAFDLFHLSFAENAEADVLLTTDVKFKKACSRLHVKILVMNPLAFLLEGMENERGN
jgi:predicted nucleic acid-binding protein